MLACNFSCLRWLLAPIAPLYWLAVAIRNWAFNRNYRYVAKVSVPVISVGNITAGGTGKTPITIYISKALEKEGLRANIISRGYGGRQDFGPMVVNSDSSVIQSGDEPLMMAQRLGPNRVVVGRKRHHAAMLALSMEPKPDLLIMDDGFQHRKLKRDIDILLLDGIRCWGNGLMLPIGDLREPMSGVSRASCLVVTHSNMSNRKQITTWWHQWGSGGPIFWIDFTICALRKFGSTERIELKNYKGSVDSLVAFCAIGHPKLFFADLVMAGLSIKGTKSFGDHKFITSYHFQQLQAMAANAGANGLVCTEKDAVKLGFIEQLSLPIWVAEQQVVGGELMMSWLLQQAAIPHILQSTAI